MASRLSVVVLSVAVCGLLGGCVAQRTHDQLTDANRSLTERHARAVAEAQQARAEADTERQLRTRAEQAAREQAAANAALQERLTQAEGGYSNLMQRLGDLQLLDPETDRALAALAAANPELIKYDPARGMLRFSADLTFDSGQDAVKESARASLAALAKVLTADAGARYEIRIEGHTDSQPMRAATAQRYVSNIHLSCYRAIAVRSALASMGLPASRIMAAGWGEERPAVPNNANGNTPANRRVELYLTAMRAAGSDASGPVDNTAPPQRPADINK